MKIAEELMQKMIDGGEGVRREGGLWEDNLR